MQKHSRETELIRKMRTIREVSDKMYSVLNDGTSLSALLHGAKVTVAYLEERIRDDTESKRYRMEMCELEHAKDDIELGDIKDMADITLEIDRLMVFHLKHGKYEKQVQDQFSIYKNELHEFLDVMVFPEPDDYETYMLYRSEGEVKRHDNEEAVRVTCDDVRETYESYVSMWKLVKCLRKRISKKIRTD